jgi:glutaredoxin-like protein NrdH
MKELDLNFMSEEGVKCDHDLTVYALSTCGFCKKALKFLRENSIKFKYVYYDELDQTLQNKIEDTLVDQFGERLAFPFLVIDCKRYLLGFDQDEWEKELL